MLKKMFMLFFIVSVLLISGSSSASSFEEFNKYIKERDFKKAQVVLDKWGKNKDNDPQYYICLFNYHLNKSRTEGIGVQARPPQGEKTIEITDPKTGEVKGYFAPIVNYDPGEAQKGIQYLKTGINKFPDHYEMRFGLLYALKELNQYENYLSELENALNYFHDKRLKKIYWNNNEVISDPATFMIERAQGNFHELTEDEGILKNAAFTHKYCDLLIKYFPKHKYGYSNKGVVYYQNKDFKHALEYFLKAYGIDPRDELIAFNMGFLYKEMNDKKNARKYFKKVIEIGKEEYTVEGAKKQLELLNGVSR